MKNFTGSIRTLVVAGLAIVIVMGFSPGAVAAGPPDQRWGLSIWGLSYHIDRSIDYDEVNPGIGLRYYFNGLVFFEADAVRNSNRGLVLPVSAGLDFKVASLGHACDLYAVAVGTVAYYQNPRRESDYVKAGPVPGVTVGCGRVKTNALVVLKASHEPIVAIAASVTIMVR